MSYCIKWSPYEDTDDLFVSSLSSINHNYLRLYNVLPNDSPSRIPKFRLRHEIPDLRAKCMAWHPERLMMAVGLNSGAVQLHDFKNDSIIQEFTPHYRRACNVVAWNIHQTNHFAAGLDRVESKESIYSFLVWDIEAEKEIINVSGVQKSVFKTPLGKMAEGEGITAISFFPSNKFCIAVGTAIKFLRIYDYRQNLLKSVSDISAHDQGVFGVKFDPFNIHRLATFSVDGLIKIWDYRMIGGEQDLSSPVLTIESSPDKLNRKPVEQIEWCPTRKSYMASICKDEDFIRFYDFSGDFVEMEGPNVDSSSNSRIKTQCYKMQETQGIVSCLTWHPRDKQRLLTINTNGVIRDWLLRDFVPIAWSPLNTFSFSFGKQWTILNPPNQPNMLNTDDLKIFPSLFDDISFKMRSRVKQEYCLNIWKNLQLSLKWSDLGLERVWGWMLHSYNFFKKEYAFLVNTDFDPRRILKHRGINNFNFRMGIPLKDNSSNNTNLRPFCGIRSFLENMKTTVYPWEGKQTNLLPPFKIYCCQGRSQALRACGWFDSLSGNQSNNNVESEKIRLDSRLKHIEERGDYERACALALFHLDMEHALSLLFRGGKTNRENANTLNLAGLILSSLLNKPEEKNIKSWKYSYTPELLELQHPYLRAAFSFLSTNAPSSPTIETYSPILEELSLPLHERIAFACRFLPDNELHQFLDGQIDKSLREGSLDGLILTGLKLDGIDIIQSFVDHTSDTQTGALLSCYALATFNIDPEKTSYLTDLTQTYRRLLNTWRMWIYRAQFDVELSKLRAQMISVLPYQPVQKKKKKKKKKRKTKQKMRSRPSNRMAMMMHGRRRMLRRPADNRRIPHDQRRKDKNTKRQLLLNNERQATNAKQQTNNEEKEMNSKKQKMKIKQRMTKNKRSHLHDEYGWPLSLKPEPQVCVCCAYCGEPLTRDNMKDESKQRKPKSSDESSSDESSDESPTDEDSSSDDSSSDDEPIRMIQDSKGMLFPKYRIKCCGKCKQPSPRCAICLIYFDLATPLINPKKSYENRKEYIGDKHCDLVSMQKFSEWFSWCQQCRHGGHAGHLAKWFSKQKQCPVTDCTCHCFSIDLNITGIV